MMKDFWPESLYGERYITPPERNAYSGQVDIQYSSQLDGYVATKGWDKIGMVIASPENYFRYLAGEVTHLFPEYDEQIHTTYEHHGSTWSGLRNGMPIFLLKKKMANRQITLPYGLYRAEITNQEEVILKIMTLHTDQYIQFRKNTSQEIVNSLDSFISNREYCEKEKIRHKQGVLLYGSPGNGKTREVCRILEQVKEKELFAIFIPSTFRHISNLDPFKEPLKDKNIVFVLEELTERTGNYDKVEELLSFLDGEDSWNHSFTIATTNYPEKIPSNVIDRPGRFDTLIEFGCPTEEEKVEYLLGRNVEREIAIQAARLAKDLSLDYLAQAVTQSNICNITICEYLREVIKNRSKILNCFAKPIGFSSSEDGDGYGTIDELIDDELNR